MSIEKSSLATPDYCEDGIAKWPVFSLSVIAEIEYQIINSLCETVGVVYTIDPTIYVGLRGI